MNPSAETDDTRAAYEQKYLKAPGFDQIEDTKLRDILVDFYVTSGTLAILRLQELLKVEADGVMGPRTLAAIQAYPEPRRLVNKLAIERIKMAGRVVKKDPSQLKWINSWLDRFASFID